MMCSRMEKRIEKKLKTSDTGEESVMRLLEIGNFGGNEPSGHEQRSQIEDINEISGNNRRNKEKKANKKVKDAEVVDVEKNSSHRQLNGVCGENGSWDARNQEQRKKKKRENEACYLPRYEVGKLKANEVLEKAVEEKVSRVKSGKAAKKERKKQKLMEIHNVGDIEREYESKSRKMKELTTEDPNDDFCKKVKRKKKKAVEDEHNEGDLSVQQNVLLILHDGDVEKHKRKKKKKKTYGNEVEEANKGKNEKTKLVVNDLDDHTPSKSNKKVSFSGQVEVFPFSDDSNTKEICDEKNLVQGKRFTPEENEIVREAVYRFIQDHNLGEDGLDMVLNCKNHPELRGCWKEIGAAIPYRPYTAVYYRAQVIFRRSASRKWTQEEYDMILKYQEHHGNEWKALADELGKHRWHVKDTWRRIKLRNMNKGQWTQKEYQNLFDLVNTDLQQKLSEEKRSKHGMLRDNICWTAISDKLSSRAQANCCIKWYKQLTSPMVAEGLWADSDDYRMLQKLYCMDAGCMEDVDWDTLLDHRSGDLCRKRWNQMAMHIGNYGTKPFSEQVDLLAQRYCPELLDAREIWDNKPRVP